MSQANFLPVFKFYRRIFMISGAIALAIGCTVNSQAQYLYGTTRSGGTGGGGTIFKMNNDGTGFAVDYNFPVGAVPGRNADYCQMVPVTVGGTLMLYGVTPLGGKYDQGVLYQYNTTNNAYTVKVDFQFTKGSGPDGSLVLASDGNLYGMTSGNGLNYGGTLFQYNPTTDVFTKKVDFGNSSSGTNPHGGLTQMTVSGTTKLYGMTTTGGSNQMGTLFEYVAGDPAVTKKIDFVGANGSEPFGNLTAASGKLYGMTFIGGTANTGTLFEYDPSTGQLVTKVNFTGANGANPKGSMMLGANGNLFGATWKGGTQDAGLLFEYTPGATSVTVRKADFSINVGGVGGNPGPTMVQLANGLIYGTTEIGGANGAGVLFEYNPTTFAYTKKNDFGGAGGYGPFGGLTLISGTSKMYGTCTGGGQTESGLIYYYDPTATPAWVRALDFNIANNGIYPENSMVQAYNGKLYGVTPDGGSYGWGVIFEYDITVSPAVYTRKIDFDASTTKGANPFAAPAIAPNGKLYGTTLTGGASNLGSIYEYDVTAGTLTKKADFDGTNLGSSPRGGLVYVPAVGKFFGMTEGGGTSSSGVIYEYIPGASSITKRADLTTNTGFDPNGNLALAPNGKLYGMTYLGGTANQGTLFEFDPSTYTFAKKADLDMATTGSYPRGSLVLASNGKFYGLMQVSASNFGSLIEYDYTGTGTLTKKQDLNGPNAPIGALVNGSGGKLYGVSWFGGQLNAGNLFEYIPSSNALTIIQAFNGDNGAFPGLGAIAQANFPPTINSFSPTSGTFGTSVNISGTNFDPSPSGNVVYFGSTRATVLTATNTQLTVVAPPGASFQPISVTSNGLTGYSTSPFRLTYASDGTMTTSSFGTNIDLMGGGGPVSAIVKDINGDSKPDLLVANNSGNSVYLYQNTALAGSIATSTLSSAGYANVSHPLGMAVDDIDGDGLPDLAVVVNQNNTVALFRNTSTPTAAALNAFASSRPEYTVGTSPYGVAIGDIDLDGKPDLVVANNGSATVSVLRNTSTKGVPFNSFSLAAKVDLVLSAAGSTGVLLSDIDKDGKPDIIVTNSNSFTIFRNASTRGSITTSSFLAKQDVSLSGGMTINNLVAGDLDGDDLPDIALSTTGNVVSVFRNKGISGGLLQLDTRLDLNSPTNPVVGLGDVNGDGKEDLVITDRGNSKVIVLKNTAVSGSLTASSFTAAVTLSTGPGPSAIVIGDLDGDARQDILTVNNTNVSTNTVSVLRNLISPDNTAPTITPTAPPAVAIPMTATFIISTSVTDNESPITRVTISLGSANKGSYTIIDSVMSQTGAHTWQMVVPTSYSTLFKDSGLEYKISAYSVGGNDTYAGAVGILSTGVSIPYTSPGKDVANYRIISIPLVLDDNSVNAIFGDELGDYGDKSKWRLFHWNGSSNTELSGSSSIDFGIGYWLISSTFNGSINSGPGQTAGGTSEGASMTVVAGYNQVGNPYPFKLSFDDLKAANGSLVQGSNFKTYNGSMITANFLNPYEGGFVQTSNAGDLYIPGTRNIALNGGRVEDAPAMNTNPISSDSWEVLINLKDSKHSLNFGGLGMHAGASDAYDQWDDITPPRFLEYLELDHPKSLHGYPFTKDIVAPDTKHVWSFDIVSSQEGSITMSWDNSYFGDNDRHLMLWDVTQQIAIDMREHDRYVINPSMGRSFKVFYGDKTYVKENTTPDKVIFHSAFPNPSSGAFTFSFSVPAKDNWVSLEVMDVMGRKLATVAEGYFDEGYHEVNWQAIDISGAPMTGMYVTRLRTNSTEIPMKIIVR